MDGSRLPKNIRPRLYELDLKVIGDEYEGNVMIELEALEATQEVYVHAHDWVQILEVSDGQSTLTWTKVQYQTLQIALSQPALGTFSLTFKFTGPIAYDLFGFYRCTHPNLDQHLLTTQFEADYARRVFPCFDEPAMKAVFRLRITVEKGYDVISNMPVESKEDSGLGDNLQTFTFARTPLMSTYLLHWTIGNLTKISMKSPSQVDISLYAYNVEGKQKFLDLASETLEFYNDYFNEPYPLDKLDLIEVYKLSFRAMENWGAVTFAYPVFNEELWGMEAGLMRNFRTLCHEISHMWFGNIVTMDWWERIWLNEGFARFMEYKALNSLRPHLQTDLFFLQDVTTLALNSDTRDSHPVEFSCPNSSDIFDKFDNISYAKGACIVRMIEHYLGPDNFQQGIQRYIQAFKYSNANRIDLFETLSTQGKENLNTLFDGWLTQPGYPVLFLNIGEENELIIQQESIQQVLHPNTVINPPILWQIPISFSTDTTKNRPKDQEIPYIVMTEDEETHDLPYSFQYIKLNSGYTGFYRVIYAEKPLELLLENLKDLSPADIFNLISDAWKLFEEGIVNFSYLFRILSKLDGKQSPITIIALTNIIKHLWFECDMRFLATNDMLNLIAKVIKPSWVDYGAQNKQREDFHEFKQIQLCLVEVLVGVAGDADVIVDLIRAKQEEKLCDYLEDYWRTAMTIVDDEEDSEVLKIVGQETGLILKFLHRSRNPVLSSKLIELLAQENQEFLSFRPYEPMTQLLGLLYYAKQPSRNEQRVIQYIDNLEPIPNHASPVEFEEVSNLFAEISDQASGDFAQFMQDAYIRLITDFQRVLARWHLRRFEVKEFFDRRR